MSLSNTLSVAALLLLSGCSLLEAPEDHESVDRELVGHWMWQGPTFGGVDHVVLNDDGSSETAGTGDSATTKGSWRATGGGVVIDEYGRERHMPVQMLPGCGAFVSNGRVYTRGQVASTCRVPAAPLTATESCLVGSFTQRLRKEEQRGLYLYIWTHSTFIYLREDRTATIETSEYDDGVSTYGRGELTWAVEGDELVMTAILSGEEFRLPLEIGKSEVCFGGDCYEHTQPDGCDPR